MKPPRSIEIYVDKDKNCPFSDQWASLSQDVQGRIGGRKDLLRKGEWDGLLSKEIVKHLKGNIYELRLNGSGVFAARVFFFTETCRGKTECVFTEVASRKVLNKQGKFSKFIERAEAMRLDWQHRHCEGKR